jgi:hypothetical protein
MSDGEDAELLVYLVEEEMDIYIGIRRCLPPWFCRADLPPCGELRKSGLGLFLGRQLFRSRLTHPPRSKPLFYSCPSCGPVDRREVLNL